MKKIILSTLILLMFVTPVLAAPSNGSDPFSTGSAKEFWDAQSQDFKNTFQMWVVNAALFALVVSFIVVMAIKTISTWFSKNSYDQHGQSSTDNSGALKIIGALIIFVLLMKLGLTLLWY